MATPAKLSRTVMSQISCQSSRSCVAVGYHYNGAATGLADLAEIWNGSKWRISVWGNPRGHSGGFLNDVSCARATGCMVVGADSKGSGNGHSMAGRYAGGRWHAQTVPEPRHARSSELNAVSCAGHACMAVGLYQTGSGQVRALAARWAGSRWRLVAAPSVAKVSFSPLEAVSCRSGSRCTAVGYSDGNGERPFAENYRGGKWRLVQGGRVAGGVLNGVACTSVSRCRAVGAVGSKPLAEAWTGHTWTVSKAQHASGPSSDTLNQVACRSGRCIAVGTRSRPNSESGSRTLAERWTGHGWRVMTTPNP
jgi:hypothetical protein